MKSMLKVALIDDNEEYGQALALRASQIGLNITHCTNLRDGIQAIKNDSEIGGLILDGYCKIDPDTPAADDFLPAAQREVDILASSFDRYLYVIINSAYPEKYESIFKRFEFVHKTSDNTILLQKVQEGVSALDETILREKYQSEIAMIKALFQSVDKEKELLSVLQRMNNQNLSEIGATLGKIRKLYEALIRKIISKEAVPQNLSARSKILYLAGRGCKDSRGHTHQNSYAVIPEYISDICFALWGLGSSGGHENRDLNPCTKNTAIGTTHLLLDLINWVGKWMNEQS